MMQHCFYNLRYIYNWTFVASARIYEIFNVNAFGAELTRGWHISLYIYQQSTMHYTDNGIDKKYSVEIRNSMLKLLYIQFKNLFAFHTPYIPTDPLQFEFENSPRTVTAAITSAVFIKLTARFVILVFISCPRWSAKACVALMCSMHLSCKQKGVLEEMVNLFPNILTKN